jgi:hypothetical protein
MTAARSMEGPSCPVESAVDMPKKNGILISDDQLFSSMVISCRLKGVGFAKQLEWGLLGCLSSNRSA